MVSNPMPERYVALHRSRSAKPPRRRAGLLKISQRMRKLYIAAKGGKGSPGMAAEHSPFSEVPPKTDCQPRHRPSRVLAPRADADLSARWLEAARFVTSTCDRWPPEWERRSGPNLSAIPVHLSAVSATGFRPIEVRNPPTGTPSRGAVCHTGNEANSWSASLKSAIGVVITGW
jgi:hypothetical protein